MQVPSLGREDPLEKEMATYSNILALEILWTEEAGRLYIVHGGHKESHMTEHACTEIYKIDNQQDLLYGTGNYSQYFVIIYKGKQSEKYTYIYIHIYI